eukprot:scaffold194453_cov36-Prasinocladus_malaysianus.AAC.2
MKSAIALLMGGNSREQLEGCHFINSYHPSHMIPIQCLAALSVHFAMLTLISASVSIQVHRTQVDGIAPQTPLPVGRLQSLICICVDRRFFAISLLIYSKVDFSLVIQLMPNFIQPG